MAETEGRTKPSGDEKYILRTVDTAIASTLGSIDTLPVNVVVKLRDVYREFIPAYLEMVRIRDNRPKEWHPEQVAIELDVVEGMGHFYSDYQQLARKFQDIIRLVKHLMTLNRKEDTRRYDALVDQIISGRTGTSVMSSLLDQ